MTAATEVTPKVWIGCLASYNAGRLIGEWTEASDLDELLATQERVKAQAIAAAKEAGEWPIYFTEPEEFFLADYEGFPRGTIGEYTPLARVAEIAALVEELGDPLAAYLDTFGDGGSEQTADEIREGFEESYRGEFETLKDYAYEFYGDVGLPGIGATAEVPSGAYTTKTVNLVEELSGYLDWDALTRDLDNDGYSESGGYIFSP